MAVGASRCASAGRQGGEEAFVAMDECKKLHELEICTGMQGLSRWQVMQAVKQLIGGMGMISPAAATGAGRRGAAEAWPLAPATAPASAGK